MKKLNIPKDIKKYVFKHRIPYAIFFLALMALVAFICVSGEYVSLPGTVLALIAAFFILAGLPVFKDNLFDKTWYGEIIKSENFGVEVPARGLVTYYIAFHRYAKHSASFMKFTLRREDEVFEKIVRCPKHTPLNSIMDIFTPGSRMLHIGGTTQYVVLKENQTSYICPVCGIENPTDNTHCHDCGHTLIKNI